MGNVANRIAKNSLFLYGRLIFTTAVSLIAVRLLLQTLGVADYGIFNLISGVIAMLQVLNGTMTASTMRFIVCAEGEHDDVKKIRVFNLALQIHFWMAVIIVAAMQFCFFFLWDHFFNLPMDRVFAAKVVFQFMVIVSFCTIVTNPYEAVIIAHERMFFFSLWGILQSAGKLLLCIALFFWGADRLLFYGFGMMLVLGGTAFGRMFYCRQFPESRICLHCQMDKKEVLQMFSFSGWTFCGNVSNTIVASGSSILLNRFFGVLVNAAEGVSMQISGQLSVFATTIMQAVNPVIMKYESSKNQSAALKIACSSCRFTVYIFLFLALPFLFEVDFVLQIWLKDVPEYTAVFCRLTVIRCVFTLLSNPFVTYLNATGKIKRYEVTESILHLGTLIFSYLLLLAGAPPIAVYVMLLLCVFARMISRIFWMTKETTFDAKDFWIDCFGRFVVITSVVLLGTLPVFYFVRNPVARFFSVCTTSSLLMILSIWRFGLTINEQQGIKELLLRKREK